MNLTDTAFEDFLKNVIPLIKPNKILDCPLEETNQYQDLKSILKKKEHIFWDRVILNYSAKIYDRDIAFNGIYQDDLINKLEYLYPNTIANLYCYYFSIDLNKHELIEEDDEYYYVLGDEKLSAYAVEKCVCSAVSQDYNSLHNYIEGFLDGYYTIKK
jgi:hypothetical protein